MLINKKIFLDEDDDSSLKAAPESLFIHIHKTLHVAYHH